MTDTDPRGDAVAKLHADLAVAGRIPNDARREDEHLRIHAAAMIELVEAVRDLGALVALAVTSTPPGYLDAPIARESEARSADEADAPEVYRVADVARYLEPGDVVEAHNPRATLAILAAGTSEGSAWLEVDYNYGREGQVRRVWLEELERDDRTVSTVNGLPVAEAMREATAPIEHVEGMPTGVDVDEPELPIVAQHAAVDADEDDGEDDDDVVPLPAAADDDESDGGEFDVVVD